MAASRSDSVLTPLGTDDPTERCLDDDDDDDDDAAEDDHEVADPDEEHDDEEAERDADERPAPDLERKYNEASEDEEEEEEEEESEREDGADDMDVSSAAAAAAAAAAAFSSLAPVFGATRSILSAHRLSVPGSCASYTTPNDPWPNFRTSRIPQHHIPLGDAHFTLPWVSDLAPQPKKKRRRPLVGGTQTHHTQTRM